MPDDSGSTITGVNHLNHKLKSGVRFTYRRNASHNRVQTAKLIHEVSIKSEATKYLRDDARDSADHRHERQ